MFSICCKRLLQKNCQKLNDLAAVYTELIDLAAISDEIIGLVTSGDPAGALPTYADDTAALADGLVAGDQYITPDGVVHQVL